MRVGRTEISTAIGNLAGCPCCLGHRSIARKHGEFNSVECERGAEQSFGSDRDTRCLSISLLDDSFTSIVPVARTMTHAGVVMAVSNLPDSLEVPRFLNFVSMPIDARGSSTRLVTLCCQPVVLARLIE